MKILPSIPSNFGSHISIEYHFCFCDAEWTYVLCNTTYGDLYSNLFSTARLRLDRHVIVNVFFIIAHLNVIV